MKKIYLLAVLLLAAGFTFAQTFSVNPDYKPAGQNQNNEKVVVDILHYDGVNANAIGLGAAATFSVFASFPATTMGPYTGYNIPQVDFFISGIADVTSVTITIYEDTTAAPVYTEVVGTVVEGWNNFMLTTPYVISGNEIFVGYELVASGGFPAGCDGGPNVATGDWMIYNSAWYHLPDLNAALTYNWNIRAYVDDGAASSGDVGVTALVAPSNDVSCTLTASEVVTVTVHNFGTTDVTTDFDVSYELNGGSVVSVTVPAGTTALAAGADLDVDFPAIDLSAMGLYEFDVYTELTGDGNPMNDGIIAQVGNSDARIEIVITTDQYGGETTWELIDANTTTVVASGGPYAANTTYNIALCVMAADCFDFTIYDAYGDGICCAYGNGNYEVFYNGASVGS
ncbi:MAG: hypothetical protein ABIJ16_09755, partial [Bacteroidota bacterium]